MDLDRSQSQASGFSAMSGAGDVPQRDRWDERLGEAMRDVAVPADLKQRILNRLEPAVAPQAEERAAGSHRRSRLTRRFFSSAVVALVLLGAAWWLGLLVPANRPVLAMTDLLTAGWDVAALPAYEDGRSPAWPEGWTSVSGLSLQAWKSGKLPGRNDGATVAVAGFDFRHRQLVGKLSGELMVVPRGWLAEAPAATNLEDGEIRYHGRNGFVAWTQGETVYVCLLHGDPGALELLRQSVANSRPLT